MIELSAYGERVVDRFNLIGMWIALVICVRNFVVCLHQYRRTRGKIHLVNLAQVTVFFIHRLLYGIIPLFEIATCAYYPFLVSLWHINYLLFYIIMFMRLLILELDRHSKWIKIVGVLFITLRFSDWPYELAFHSIQQNIMEQSPLNGETCWAQWGQGVIILNFIGDALANLFMSGMFVRRLFMHLNSSKTFLSQRNRVIEGIARKSLICFTLTFFVNLAMNILKVTAFIGDRSDAFTVYFELIESTLLVEALRNDVKYVKEGSFCESCGRTINSANDYEPHNGDDHGNDMFSNIHRSGNEKRHSSMDEFANPKFFDHQLSVIKPARLLNRESTNDIYRNNGSHWDFSFDNNNSPTITGSAAISKNTILDIDNFEKTTTIHPSHNENNFTGLA